MILFRYIARRTIWSILAAMVGVVTIYLAVDYVDNSGSYTGEGWIPAVLEPYANMAVVVIRQIAPAAMLLGAGIAVSSLRQTREYVAMRAAGLGPWFLSTPVIAVVLAFGVGLVVLHDTVGVQAGTLPAWLGLEIGNTVVAAVGLLLLWRLAWRGTGAVR